MSPDIHESSDLGWCHCSLHLPQLPFQHPKVGKEIVSAIRSQSVLSLMVPEVSAQSF